MCPPFPHIAIQNVRTGLFERADFEAVRSHMPEAFKEPITCVYLAGWRVPSEVVTLRWKQVDFSAGTVRLETRTTGAGDCNRTSDLRCTNTKPFQLDRCSIAS